MDPSILKKMEGLDYELAHHQQNRLFVIDKVIFMRFETFQASCSQWAQVRRSQAVGRDGRNLSVGAFPWQRAKGRVALAPPFAPPPRYGRRLRKRARNERHLRRSPAPQRKSTEALGQRSTQAHGQRRCIQAHGWRKSTQAHACRRARTA